MRYPAIFSILVLVISLSSSVRANVVLPSIFSDHAVLQKSTQTPIWGKADPGEKVTVSLGNVKGETTANEEGKWKLALDLHDLGSDSFVLKIEGKNTLTINDVIVGEVWVCSGQSNMEFTLNNAANAGPVIAESANTMIRQFKVSKTALITPADNCPGAWVLASPKTVGNFTAVGYFFAHKINAVLKIPVGLIHASWGGSALEAWMPLSALDQDADLKSAKERAFVEIQSYPQRLADYRSRYANWEKQYEREDKHLGKTEEYARVDVDTSTWTKVTMPALFDKVGLPSAGASWLRRTVVLPSELNGQSARIELGLINQFDEVYWNGNKVSETTPESGACMTPRRYLVQNLKKGENVLAIRVFSPGGNGGFTQEKIFRIAGQSLAGEWLAKVEYAMPPLSKTGRADLPLPPQALPETRFLPSHLFNGMISPFVGYCIAGALWYQGETNVERAFQYRTAFPAMISEWRRLWGQGNFPFYYCQLANFMAKQTQPAESDWAELREAQSMALSLPNTGQAVLIDIGEEQDIHPRNKRDAGERLAQIALVQTYNQRNMVFSGPVYDSAVFNGDKVIVKFKYADGGLIARPLPSNYQPKSSSETIPLLRNSPDSEVEGFAICSEDKQWKWANAKIEKDTVVVSSPDVPRPIAVRYAWANNPTCNLHNQAGLPACPFRSDQFPGKTLEKK